MLLKEFNQKLKIFLKENTGKYKLRLVDKKNNINSFISIFSIDPQLINVANAFNLYEADLLNQAHFCISYGDINNENEIYDYMNKDVLVNLKEIIDIINDNYNDTTYLRSVFDIPVYIYYMKDNDRFSNIYNFINLQDIEINDKKKTIDLILGDIIYESVVVEKKHYWTFYNGMEECFKKQFLKF